MDYRQMIGFVTGKGSKHPYPQHLQDGRKIAGEGMVLLKNEKHTLPLKAKAVALFGAGAVDTITCGTGSGFVAAPYKVNVKQGLEKAGIQITSNGWIKRFEDASKKANKEDKTLSKIDRMWSGLSILIDEIAITDEDIQEAGKADTAIYVIRRNAGEGNDRKAAKGDYYLSDLEEENIRKVAAAFAHTIVVLNTCVMDANFLNEIPGIDAALLMSLPGNEAGNAVADIITGKVNPSGHLTDTWAKKYEDNPASGSFGANDGDSLQEDYVEDIFVGYRYFDTFGVEPLYPFGYGLSYTTFEMHVEKVEADWKQVALEVQVKNTGDVAGRAVPQVYVTAPEGTLTKPYQELKGYGKTGIIQPGQTQQITISFATETLASYSEAQAAFLMEAGDYVIRLGAHSRDTHVAACITVDDLAVLRTVKNQVPLDKPLETMKAPKRQPEKITGVTQLHLIAKDCITIDGILPAQPEHWTDAPATDATLVDVAEGNVSMEAFVNSLDEEVLYRLVAGSSDETPYQVPSRCSKKYKPVKGPSSSGSTTSLFASSLAIPNLLVTDGPAGCHLPLCGATSYPVGVLIAQTWDDEMARLAGTGIGKELAYYNYSVILGPGMNIHRDPLCGRAFEYYAEDPLISGKVAAATTKGVQSTPGTGVSIKHFACNNQEADRLDENNTVTERALREIYLRGFEICVREADPMTIMTSYNKINGEHVSSRQDLLEGIVRGEWGFDGLVMTDWGTHSNKAYDLAAGNDLIMGGYRSDFLKAAVHGLQPEFVDNGYVKEEEFKVFGGFFTNVVESWNVFELDAKGEDTVSTTVQPGVALNEKIAQKVEEQVAEITEHEDGSKTITYRGCNRGAYLSLDDVRKCAARNLKQMIRSLSYQIMTK